MFREEYQAVCGAAKKKVEFLEKNPLGYVTAAFLAGMFVGLGCVLMGVVGGYFNAAGSPATKLLNGLIFAVGLNFVFMAGTVYRKQFYNECSIYKRRSFLGGNDQSVDRLLSGKSARFCCDSRNLYDDRTDERTGSWNVLEKCGSGESLRSSDGAFCKSDPL